MGGYDGKTNGDREEAAEEEQLRMLLAGTWLQQCFFGFQTARGDFYWRGIWSITVWWWSRGRRRQTEGWEEEKKRRLCC